MAHAKVELSWSELRPRRNTPDGLVRSIPPQDLTAFVHRLAMRPLHDSSDATALRNIVLSLRHHQLDHLSVHNTNNHPLSVFPLNQKRRREADADRPGSENARPVLHSTTHQPHGRKQRRLPASPEPAEPDLDRDAAKDRPHPSTAHAFNKSGGVSRGRTVPLGPKYQADLPPVPPPKMPRPQRFDPPPVQPYYTPELLPDAALTSFLKRLTAAFQLRDGVPPGPFIVERAVEELVQRRTQSAAASAAADGDSGAAGAASKRAAAAAAALREERATLHGILQETPRGPYYPGLRNALTRDEHCMLARALKEGSKNFEYMSRNLLPARTTHELVWVYYALYKQSGAQQMAMTLRLGSAPMAESGGDAFKKLAVAPGFALAAVSSLARTAGDGFPVDSRISKMVMQYRTKAVQSGRRRREMEPASRGRLR